MPRPRVATCRPHVEKLEDMQEKEEMEDGTGSRAITTIPFTVLASELTLVAIPFTTTAEEQRRAGRRWSKYL